ncbi:hypothetical protein [Campylobacter porcelli]|uniref:Uncharacterized protein n=1 Tax=Campylobacter porcelli TaxID=1660073 RepID=A0A1X9SV06_9BACT|nr:hypothetical protein [Campylobacter sp. RM6137]ARR00108.1 hypothetical protein CSUIS_0263 [Campylobacter sp. RM6137]
MKISKITSAAIISFGLSGSLYADIPPIDKYDTLDDPKYQHIRDFYAFALTSTYDHPRDTNFWTQELNTFIDNKINSGISPSEAELTQTINDFINIYPKLNITIEQIQSQIDKYTDIIANNPTYSDLKSFGEALIYYQNARNNPSGNQGLNVYAARKMAMFYRSTLCW